MPRLCNRCGTEIPDLARVGQLRVEIAEEGHGEGDTQHRTLCSSCVDLILEQWDDPDGGGVTQTTLELLEAPRFGELVEASPSAWSNPRETALLAAANLEFPVAGRTRDEAVADVIAAADAFVEWLQADLDLDDAADGAPGR